MHIIAILISILFIILIHKIPNFSKLGIKYSIISFITISQIIPIPLQIVFLLASFFLELIIPKKYTAYFLVDTKFTLFGILIGNTIIPPTLQFVGISRGDYIPWAITILACLCFLFFMGGVFSIFRTASKSKSQHQFASRQSSSLFESIDE